MTSLEDLAHVFHQLGHPTKLEIFICIMRSPEGSSVPTLLAQNLNIRLSTISHSLNRMHEAGVLRRHKTGRYAFYSIDKAMLNDIRFFFRENLKVEQIDEGI